MFVAYEIERRPRGASRASSLLHLFRANYSWGELRAPLAHGVILRFSNKAVARGCHRHNWPETNGARWCRLHWPETNGTRWCRLHWPETNVGASLLAMRRAGGARFAHHHKNHGVHTVALSQSAIAGVE
ncbi:hypothetical protein J3A98_003990 [Pseudomonas sp. BP6]|uniref:hypothetical protein n=1 Tax=Pseudomonas sp. BP6 TaxID=2817863 RepID=UPI001AE164D4|nr:hypothetical protein [Pseudomonas sp. BP6]MBP2273297.1 hypothetical protein [Pseudomonas sp. BP6]